MNEGYIKIKKFKDIDLSDSFFESLKNDYPGFDKWFLKKQDESAHVLYNIDNKLDGFLYVKMEYDVVEDIFPKIISNRILKIGTFKINPHGTKLGERFIKKSLDVAIANHADVCYVTIFERHTYLINLFKKYGFYVYGKKGHDDNPELVLLKKLKKLTHDILLDFPLLSYEHKNIYLLAIYPDYHSKMFPDSILNNESFDILEDQSPTNSIHKIYISGIPSVCNLNIGDIIVIYRTSDQQGPAEYRSVATSICTVENVETKNNFISYADFYKYVNPYSIFDEKILRTWYNKHSFYVIKLIYNVSLSKRIIRKNLIENIGISRNERPSFMKLTQAQLCKILEEGAVNESYVIDKA